MTFFKKRNLMYNFRKNSTFETNINSVYYGSETISFLDPKMWELLPSNIKDTKNLNIFKSNIKSWKTENFAHVICGGYILQNGFIKL